MALKVSIQRDCYISIFNPQHYILSWKNRDTIVNKPQLTCTNLTPFPRRNFYLILCTDSQSFIEDLSGEFVGRSRQSFMLTIFIDVVRRMSVREGGGEVLNPPYFSKPTK